MEGKTELNITIPEKELREIVLKIEDNPHSDEIWLKLVGFAEKEQKAEKETKYQEVRLGELVEFGERLRSEKDFDKKHRMLMERVSGGQLWYDIILGEANDRMFQPAENELKKIAQKTGKKWSKGLDVGTGSGNTLRKIAPYCEKAIGIDKEHFVLEVAKEQGLPVNSKLAIGSADNISFKDASFDLVVSNGLTYYFSKEEAEKYINEVKRLLRSNGIYLTTMPIKEDEELLSKLEQDALTDAKSLLVYLLGQIAIERGGLDLMGAVEMNELFLNEGFDADFVGPNEYNVYLLKYTKR